jgi:hypothetical protein
MITIVRFVMLLYALDRRRHIRVALGATCDTVASSEVVAVSKSADDQGYRPQVGDEVLYHADEKWCAAEVLTVHKSGELALLYESGTITVRQRSTHGNHLYGWLSYDEAADGAARETATTDA